MHLSACLGEQFYNKWTNCSKSSVYVDSEQLPLFQTELRVIENPLGVGAKLFGAEQVLWTALCLLSLVSQLESKDTRPACGLPEQRTHPPPHGTGELLGYLPVDSPEGQRASLVSEEHLVVQFRLVHPLVVRIPEGHDSLGVVLDDDEGLEHRLIEGHAHLGFEYVALGVLALDDEVVFGL